MSEIPIFCPNCGLTHLTTSGDIPFPICTHPEESCGKCRRRGHDTDYCVDFYRIRDSGQEQVDEQGVPSGRSRRAPPATSSSHHGLNYTGFGDHTSSARTAHHSGHSHRGRERDRHPSRHREHPRSGSGLGSIAPHSDYHPTSEPRRSVIDGYLRASSIRPKVAAALAMKASGAISCGTCRKPFGKEADLAQHLNATKHDGGAVNHGFAPAATRTSSMSSLASISSAPPFANFAGGFNESCRCGAHFTKDTDYVSHVNKCSTMADEIRRPSGATVPEAPRINHNGSVTRQEDKKEKINVKGETKDVTTQPEKRD